jgi:GNAT superfamily N-acetyltransferase
VAIKIEPLSGQHDRTSFSCGEPELDDYFRRRAGQDERRNVARVFVASDDVLGVVGFYTLSTCSIRPGELPNEITRKLPRYDTIPAALIGRLARNLRARGRGIGELLLVDAIKRVLAADRSMAVWAILVDAKNQAATDFYKNFGFVPFPSRPTRLFLPTATARKAASAGR